MFDQIKLKYIKVYFCPQPMMLGCGNAFCSFCIEEWKRKSTGSGGTCPNCRTKVTSITRAFMLENLIESLFKDADEQVREERETYLSERKGNNHDHVCLRYRFFCATDWCYSFCGRTLLRPLWPKWVSHQSFKSPPLQGKSAWKNITPAPTRSGQSRWNVNERHWC